MKHHSLLVTVLVGAGLVLTSCGGEQTTQAAAPQAASVAPAGPKSASAKTGAGAKGVAANIPQEPEKPPVLTVPDNYNYEPRGRHDPFLNPIPKEVTQQQTGEIPIVRPDGMRGMLVAETKISGIVTSRSPGMTKAIVSSGRQTYFAVRGDAFFDGVIKEIRPDGVVFTMISPVTKAPVNRETLVPTGTRAATATGDKK